jgi:hypothetical protein
MWTNSARALVTLLILAGVPLLGQEKEPDEVASKQRLALMEQTIAALAASSDATLPKAALTFTKKPLLRYSDPTRGTAQGNVLVDASVWRLGETGRPTALVTLEIYRTAADKALFSYEFAALADAKFSLRHKQQEKIAWNATGSAASMTPLADAPQPAKTAAGRLTQMRGLARQFTARETLFGETFDCRLLAQPIDRYSSAADKIVDGAIFAFANGTNPELGLLLECDDERWSYGVVRLSAAASTLEYQGREVANFPAGDFRATSGTYSAASHDITLPQ